MSDLDDSFAKLLGTQPTEKQKQDLYRVRDALGLKGNDALWLVLMALQHYQGIYETIPERIEDAARGTLQSFENAADAKARAAAESIREQVTHAAVSAAWDLVRKVETRERLKWFSMTLAACVFLLTGLAWLMYAKGEDAGKGIGYGAGYNAARAEDAAAAAGASNSLQGGVRIDSRRRR